METNLESDNSENLIREHRDAVMKYMRAAKGSNLEKLFSARVLKAEAELLRRLELAEVKS